MSLSSRALCTLEELKQFLGISDVDKDMLLEKLVESSSNIIENYVGYDPHYRTYTDRIYTGEGTTRMWLKDVPVITLTAVKLEGTAISAEELAKIILHDNYLEGQYYVFVRTWDDNYKLTYTAGYNPDDADPDRAADSKSTLALFAWVAMRIAGLMYKETGPQGILGVSSQSFDISARSFYDTQLTNYLHELDNYMRLPV
jgi:hypothetical protein